MNGEEKEEGTRNGERETRNGEEKEEEEGVTGNAVTGNAEGGAENGEEEEEEEGVTGNVFPEQARGQRICLQPIYLPGHVVKCD